MRRKEEVGARKVGRQKKENSRSGDLLAPLCGAAGRVGERSPVHGRGKPVSVQSGLHTSALRPSTFTLYDSNRPTPIQYPAILICVEDRPTVSLAILTLQLYTQR